MNKTSFHLKCNQNSMSTLTSSWVIDAASRMAQSCIARPITIIISAWDMLTDITSDLPLSDDLQC